MRANGTAIEGLREARKLSRKELSEAIGISRGHLSRIERGKVGASPHTLRALADYFGVEADALTRGVPVPGTDATSAVLDMTGPDQPELNDLALYKPYQAADLTQIPETWLRRRAGQRRIPCTYVGVYLRFSADDIRELIAMHRIDPKTGLPRQAARAAKGAKAA